MPDRGPYRFSVKFLEDLLYGGEDRPSSGNLTMDKLLGAGRDLGLLLTARQAHELRLARDDQASLGRSFLGFDPVLGIQRIDPYRVFVTDVGPPLRPRASKGWRRHVRQAKAKARR